MTKYIKDYNSVSGATEDITIVSPNLSYVKENNVTKLLTMDCPTIDTPLKIYDNDGTLDIDYAYLTFTCTQAGGISLTNYGGNTPNVEYKKNNDAWVTWDYSNITMAVGDRVCMRGLNPNGFCYNITKYSNFVMTGSINASGNIMTLIDKTGATKEMPQVPSCFCRLFKNCASLKTCCQLPATTLYGGCYFSLFMQSGVIDASKLELPAMTMTTYKDMWPGDSDPDCGCYHQMFTSCTNLINAPELPATTLTNDCYNYMFHSCSSLVNAPVLPATTLASHCYANMFHSCSSLVNAPSILPATTLANSCYSHMFEGCSSLVNAPELPATTLATNCCYCMFRNCSNLVNAPTTLPAMTILDGYKEGNYIYSPYAFMFEGCSGLVNAPELPATTLGNYCYYYMFHSCSSLVNAPELPATTLANMCYRSMFYGCTKLTTAPLIAGKTHKTLSYDNMFEDCAKLNYVKCLLENPDEMPSDSNWLYNVSATGTFVKKAGVTWSRTGASGIPANWTVEEVEA